MATSTSALLPNNRKKDDHPIFLRVCHSPWVGIGQKALVGLRGMAAAYMLVSFLMIIDYEFRHNKHGWMTVFEFSNVQYLLQVLYHVIAFTWTFMHLHYPHHGNQTQNASTRIQKFFSPPRQHSTTNNRTWFSIFYTAANSFPYTSLIIHWAILIPQNKATIPADQVFNHGWFTSFFVLNKWGVTSLVALIEVLFLSSIRTPEPIYAHIVGQTALSFIYIGWAYIGYIVTDGYPFYFLDHKQVGWDHVVGYWVGFAALNNFFYFVVYGITGLRQLMTQKCEGKKSGYQQLP